LNDDAAKPSAERPEVQAALMMPASKKICHTAHSKILVRNKEKWVRDAQPAAQNAG